MPASRREPYVPVLQLCQLARQSLLLPLSENALNYSRLSRAKLVQFPKGGPTGLLYLLEVSRLRCNPIKESPLPFVNAAVALRALFVSSATLSAG